MLLARQFQNGTLARYPNAVQELATFAFASSTFMLFNAALIFVPQMANVFARSRDAKRMCLRFTVLVCLILTGPLAFIAFTPLGKPFLAMVFNIQGDTLDNVMKYLRYLLPLILINGLSRYYTGLLVQVRRTGQVTLVNVTYLAALIGILVAGVYLRWSAVTTLALAQVAAGLLHLVLSFALHLVYFRLPEQLEHENLSYREIFAFFWPVATTSTMFALSRPILYSFVSRIPDSQPTIAALRVTFDFAMIFHSPINEFRNLFVTFGHRDLAGLRRFMTRVLICISALMALVAATPISTVVFKDLLGIEDQVLEMAQQSIWILCLVPLIIGIRNYFHGLSLVGRRTGRMAAGAICRNVVIYLLSWGLCSWGLLDHVTAAAILILGFVSETVVVFAFELSRPAQGQLRDPSTEVNLQARQEDQGS